MLQGAECAFLVSAGHPAQYAPHLYEPELNLLTDRHHKQLLRNGCPAVRYQHTEARRKATVDNTVCP
ncbi:hypothetical protein WJX74_001093 [Apatococcus lobatus]|uniref:Uncharacterized protein n=1 Tax=Apatococcus lobatus TaxID=904363 RepID=A0AAW1RK56_9CHLO